MAAAGAAGAAKGKRLFQGTAMNVVVPAIALDEIVET
jgi:Na+-transporting NADH:ubiquinone oxidoreductase subunit NqrB